MTLRDLQRLARVYTVIGCGPNGEVNCNDLAHEAYEAWCQIHGKAATNEAKEKK